MHHSFVKRDIVYNQVVLVDLWAEPAQGLGSLPQQVMQPGELARVGVGLADGDTKPLEQ